ncbi:MAG TPA: methyltransferase, TIGR04325 family [Acidimicrobiia bacterium]|nr:methyltransferase, TIGR04325 family [Acidimicrobiia bacterium]
MTFRSVLRSVTPPIVVTGWRRARERLAGGAGQPEWEYVPDGWAGGRTVARGGGWDSPTIPAAYRAKLASYRAVVDGTRPLAVSTSPSALGHAESVGEQNTLLAFAYALTLASRDRDTVSVLDWGGGIGLYALLARAFLPDGVHVEYHVRDVPCVCAVGRAALPEVHFHEDDTGLDRTFDLVVASSSIQYEPDWKALVARLAHAAARYLFLTRVPVVFASPAFVVVQRPRQWPGVEYPSWVFNRDELVECACDHGMTLRREYLLAYRPVVVGAPEQQETRGFLFAPAPARGG